MAPIGSNKVYKCGILQGKIAQYQSEGYWTGRIVYSSSKLSSEIISLDLSNNEVVIRPPYCELYYKMKGNVTIECTYRYVRYQIEFTFNKTISIIDESMEGSLNGIDNSDIIILNGTYRPMKCHLLPKSLEDGVYSGYWNIEIIKGQSNEILTVEMCRGKGIIHPPKGSQKYTTVGEATVQCTFKEYTSDRVIYSFNKSILVEARQMKGTLNNMNTLDIIIPLGSNVTSQCGVLPKGTESLFDSYWETEFTSETPYLLSLVNESILGPPVGSSVYNTIGKAIVTCTLKSQIDDETVFRFEKSIEIVDKKIIGTLNGIDEANISLTVGNQNRLKCGLLPKSTESLYKGYWEARIISQSSDNLVSIEKIHNDAVIKPPESSRGEYRTPGHLEVECIYKLHKTDYVYFSFKKYIEIDGK
ncbi:unnamed protein product [Trichobilharzia regenti]|nr:unnamed protein product [Trichobilharzia regenti]